MTTAEAIQEARRCLNCARPTCRTGCPIENNIPGFIRALSEGNIGMAYEIISERSNLPAICGRVCPHERQCEAHCVLTKKKCGIEIGSLEMFIADFAHNNDLKSTQPSSKLRGKVAVIGSGPLRQIEGRKEHDHKIDRKRNGDAHHIQRDRNDQLSFQAEHDHDGKQKGDQGDR